MKNKMSIEYDNRERFYISIGYLFMCLSNIRNKTDSTKIKATYFKT